MRQKRSRSSSPCRDKHRISHQACSQSPVRTRAHSHMEDRTREGPHVKQPHCFSSHSAHSDLDKDRARSNRDRDVEKGTDRERTRDDELQRGTYREMDERREHRGGGMVRGRSRARETEAQTERETITEEERFADRETDRARGRSRRRKRSVSPHMQNGTPITSASSTFAYSASSASSRPHSLPSHCSRSRIAQERNAQKRRYLSASFVSRRGKTGEHSHTHDAVYSKVSGQNRDEYACAFVLVS